MNIYNTYAPQSAELPFVVFAFSDISHSSWIGSSAGRAETTVDFEIVARTHAECMTIGNDLQSSLSGFSGYMGGTNIHNAEMIDHEDMTELRAGTKVHVKLISYLVSYVEPIPLCQFELGTTSEEFEKELVTYLAPVATIYYAQLPARPTLPALVYRRTDGQDHSYLNSVVNTDRQYQFQIVAASQADLWNTSLILRNKLDGLSGSIGEANILEFSLDRESQDYEIKIGDKVLRTLEQTYDVAISPA